MSAEDEGRTEEPSEYKLEKARKEGRVAKSQEISGALTMLVSVVMIIFLSKMLLGELTNMMRFYFDHCGEHEVKDPTLVSAFFSFFLKCSLPIVLISAIAAVVSNIVQTKGFIFSLKPIEPKFSKILPKVGEYLKKTMFSQKGMFNIFKSLFKVFIIGFVGFLFIKKDILILLQTISNGDIGGALINIAKMCAQILITVAVIFLCLSIPDYFIQKKDFMEEMKMTKQEQKEEYKEMEGDPEVKGKLKQMQQEMLKQNIPKAVAESDVVITNPTHFAVALKYDTSIADSPMVNAKGADEVAFKIKKIASENNIPIVENRPMARELYTNVELGDIIPEVYYNTVAVIYSHLEKFKNKK